MTKKSKRLEELEFTDDFMFGAVMTNKEICRRFLEVVLCVSIERIEYTERQKIIDVAAFGKSVRLDVYLKDDLGTIYSVEMQQRNKGNLPKRSRYYQAMNDLDQLDKGKRYVDLGRSIIIFVCTFDPFGEAKQLYSFENRCGEIPELLLGDETMKIFLNAKGRPGQVSPQLDMLLAYIHHPEENGKHQSELVKKIADEVSSVRISEKWRREYMALEILLSETREEGRAEGRKETTSQIILRMAELGKTTEEIAELTGCTAEEVKQILNR